MMSAANMSRRVLLGYFAAVPAAMALPALPALALPVTRAAPVAAPAAAASIAASMSIEERLALLPPEVAARLRIEFNKMIDAAWRRVYRRREKERKLRAAARKAKRALVPRGTGSVTG
ncbi:hypothetical protein [Mesorhizobium helmanticense]|uniref:hypothetical protein n=1 Tax=Mesorhizobium helmanticense TaxID=1776423 RepID=UPI000D1F0B07|nr:hypothetical protein [Mesorhizobium helmanticense]